MWAIIENNVIVKTIRNPKAVSINDIQYPKTIFSSSWTDVERKAIGILPYVFEGVSVNNMFYTTSESSPVIEDDRVCVTRTKTEIDIDVIKNNMLSLVNETLASSLAQTDWIVIREQDNGTAKPTDLAQWRNDLRTKAADLSASISSKSSVKELEDMQVAEYSSNNEVTKEAEFYDWPKNPREPSI